MSLSDPRISYGVHSIAAYNRTSGAAYGIAKVLGSANFSITGELNQLFGGASKYAWAIEEGNVTAELQMNTKQVEDWMIELFLGKAPTSTSTPSAAGSVSTPVAVKGALIGATTGLASVTVESGEEDELKFGKYIIIAASATTVNLYALSDIDFNRGTDKLFENDLLLINASPLTVSGSSGTTSITGFGLELTGGSGTVALTAGDSVNFEVMPAYSKKMEVTIGGSNDTFPEFGAVMVAQQRSNGEMFEIDAYRLKGAGLPFGFAEKEFAAPEITAQAFYDSTKNAVARARWVLPS